MVTASWDMCVVSFGWREGWAGGGHGDAQG